MKDNNNEILMFHSPAKALAALGFPTMIGMLLSALYNLADAYFVGTLGTVQVAAIAVLFPLNQIIVGIGMMFGTGAASRVSRLLGAGKKKEADETASTALVAGVLFQLFFISMILLFLRGILSLLGASIDVMPYAEAYGRIYIMGSFLSVFYVMMNNIITAEGAAAVTMRAMLIGAGLNILLDPIFISVLGWGVRGAAWATVLSQFVTVLFYLYRVFSRQGSLFISVKHFKPTPEILKNIFSVGFPVLLFQLLFSLSQGLTNTLAGQYGDEAVAASGIGIRIVSIGSFAVFGFIKGYQPLAGYAYGANNFDRLKEVTKTALMWIILFGSIFTGILVFCSEPLMRAFSQNQDVVTIGHRLLMWNGASFLLFGYQIVISTLFLALGKAKEGGILSISRNGLFFMPLIMLFSRLFGLNGVLIAQPAADLVSAVLTTVLLVKLLRSLNAERESFTALDGRVEVRA